MKNIFWIVIAISLVIGYFWWRSLSQKQGEQIEDFSAELIDGSSFQLSDLQGNWILLDFWGSWCGPCRRENPQVVALYEEFHASGLQVVSVGLETNRESWKRAIEADNLSWPYHIYQGQRTLSPIALKYHIREIPSKILLNPEGVIMAVNPSFDIIRQLLAAQKAQ